MNAVELRTKIESLHSEAKRLAESLNTAEGEARDEARRDYDKAMNEAKALRGDLQRAIDLEAQESFLNDASTVPLANQFALVPDTSKAANPGDETPYDPQGWREVTIFAGTLNERKVRFHVPLATEAKGYGAAYEVFLRKGMDFLGPQDRKALMEGNDSAGGFFVSPDIQAEVLKKTATMASFSSVARHLTTGRDLVNFRRINYSADDKYTSGVRLTWTGEIPASSTTADVTDPVVGQIAIAVNTAMANMPVSNDLLDDADTDIVAYISQVIAEGFALGINDVGLNGTGSGQPMGLLTQAGGLGPATVITGTASALSTTADAWSGKRILDLYYAVPAQYRMAAKWILNSTTMSGVESLVDGNKRPIVNALNQAGLPTGEPTQIKGKQVLIDEFMPDFASDGALPIAFGDFSGYLFVDRVGISIRRLNELLARTNEQLFVARQRVGGYCIEPYKLRILKASAS